MGWAVTPVRMWMGVLEMMVVIGRLPVLQLLCCEALWCLNQGWKSWCACCARTAEIREANMVSEANNHACHTINKQDAKVQFTHNL